MPELLIYPANDRDAVLKIWPGGESLPPGFLHERGDYYLELRNTKDPDDCDLWIDGTPLEALRSPDRTTALWRWSVGYYSGKVSLGLDSQGCYNEIEVVADPDLAKLTSDQYHTMIGEILEDTLALFSLTSYRIGVGKGTGNRPPIARLEYLRSRVVEIEETVRSINRNPIRSLRSSDETIGISGATKLSARDLTRSYRGSPVIRWPGGLGGGTGNRSFLPTKVRISSRKTGLDTREHRLIKQSLRMWVSWLSVTAALLEGRPTDPEFENQQKVWARRCRIMVSRLTSLLMLPLFDEVSDSNPGARVSPVFRRVSSYRRFYRLRSEFLLGISNILCDHLDLPIARTFDLYELWVFLRLTRAAIHKFGLERIEGSSLVEITRDGFGINLSAEQAVLKLKGSTTIAFKRRYREYWLNAKHRGSFSRTMIPDVSLSIENAECGVVVFDAKYRIESDLNDAIASIHMYRDALVQENTEDNLKQIVRGAYLVSPHVPGEMGAWKTEGMPGRLFHPEYRSTFRFGALTMKPGMDLDEVSKCLSSALDDAGIPTDSQE